MRSNYVDVSMNMRVFQNLTDLEPGFSLPASNGILTGDNATSLASIIQASIQNKASGANVSNLSLKLSSSALMNSAQWFNVSLQFRITGISTAKSGFQYVNMDWKSFSLAQNVTVGAVEVNNIGTAYLESIASTIAQLERASTNTKIISYGNIVNYFRVTTPNLVSASETINLLNFTQLIPAIDTWQENYDSSSNSQTWTFYINKILGLMVTATSSEPQATPTADGVIYTIQATVSAPARSFAQGDTIVAVFNDNSETVMLAIIVVGVIVLVSSLIVERRISKRSVRRKAKR